MSARTFIAILSLGAFSFLSACTSTYDPELKQDPNFSLGYNDGCSTGNGRVQGFKKTVQRNDDLFDDSQAYQIGWREGYAACGGSNYRDETVFGGEDPWYEQGPL